jgi:hypothetical protein
MRKGVKKRGKTVHDSAASLGGAQQRCLAGWLPKGEEEGQVNVSKSTAMPIGTTPRLII